MSWQRGWGEMTPGTDARPVVPARTITLSRGEFCDLVEAMERRHRRAVKWVGVAAVALGLICGAGATSAFGDTIQIGRVHINGIETLGTSVTLWPSTDPGVLATVTMENRHVNDGGDSGSYPLVMDDLTVEVRFIWDADPVLGSDRIEVIPPPGRDLRPRGLCGHRHGGFHRHHHPFRLAGDVG
jgi:hypothetical protein